MRVQKDQCLLTTVNASLLYVLGFTSRDSGLKLWHVGFEMLAFFFLWGGGGAGVGSASPRHFAVHEHTLGVRICEIRLVLMVRTKVDQIYPQGFTVINWDS